jgi:uncharacterized phage-associated protein
MLLSAQTIADYILHFFQWKNDPINNSKLQKLLYYVQGWHLAIHDRPAFPERLEAWIPGPVCPPVDERYRSLRWYPILDEVHEPQGLPGTLTAVIDDVLQLYGFDTGWDLERRVHLESPWNEARRGVATIEESTAEITHESMKRFFKAEATAMEG